MVSLAASVVLSAGTLSGDIRLGIIDQNNDTSSDSYATALGGILKYETASWNNMKLGAAGYVSQKVAFASGAEEKLNLDFLDENGNSFAYLGEAYIDYHANDFNLRVGRQLIDTPFADTDDVRMLPNTFEGAMALYSGIDKTTVNAGYLQRWAGFDSPRGHNDSINEFKKFGEDHDSSGVYLLGITNESINNLALQGWIYNVDNATEAFYADTTYTINTDGTITLLLGAQYALFKEKRNSNGVETDMDGSVYGFYVRANMGIFSFAAAYNRTFNDEGKYCVNGLGGGPYYTSMEEMTIDGVEDAAAYQVGAEVDISSLGVEGLRLASMYGAFKSVPMNAKMTETDIIAVYDISDRASADVSYAKIEDKKNNFNSGSDAGYSRFLARLNYKF
jgi:hypothetical protein